MLRPPLGVLNSRTTAGPLVADQPHLSRAAGSFFGQLRSFAHKRPEERQARIPRERLIAKAIITPEAYGRISLDDRRVIIDRAYEPARNDDEAL
jgi:hypothetical protein